jgi:uncharacterized membrane protein HdeD (DUF308 family)
MTDFSTRPADVSDGEDTASFWLLFALGVATMCFGIAILAWPGASVRVVAVMVGVWLLLTGLSRIVGAFVLRRGLGRQLLSGIVGILLVIGGVACLRDLTKGAAVLAFVVALMWVLSGIAELVIAQQADPWARRWLIVLGVASLVVGFVFVFSPQLTLAVMALLTGLSALAIGGAQVLFAFRLRRLMAGEPAPMDDSALPDEPALRDERPLPDEPGPASWPAWDATSQATDVVPQWPTNPSPADRPRGFTEP